MSGNTFGTRFKITTWGESHGPAIGVVVDGCLAGLKLDISDIQKEVDRRKPAKNSKVSTTRREKDKVEILSGVFEGKTTGMPISLVVFNKDTRSKDYSKIKNLYRPGHADFTYDIKYGSEFRDYRGGGRSSGRETLARVMAGAIAKKLLKEREKTQIFGHTIQVGSIKAKTFSKSFIEKNELRCADKKAAKEMQKLIEETRFKEGDSIGCIIEIIIKNPPKGIGHPVFDKLDADLAKAMMSIGSVKGVEIGSGFEAGTKKGSENNDQMSSKNNKIEFLSNNAGGILGGISTGEDIVIRLAIKPVPSISKELKTITNKGKNTKIKTLGRHDTCLGPRIIPVAESMAAVTILDKIL
ncbi:chorismate synthase [Candidatus Peregrinibacteria bacterium]|jgi:chorismate synthase|nr:chorismate synthase [Candidatus Peregrinibacteria bacterium]MBT7736572.1 chorismate synthase [Candidatus Peregrinibacteria bacterium]